MVKKLTTKRLILSAFLAMMVSVAASPLSASAHSGNFSRDNEWNWDSEWRAQNCAHRFFEHKRIVREEFRRDRDRDDERELRVHFSDGSWCDVDHDSDRVVRSFDD